MVGCLGNAGLLLKGRILVSRARNLFGLPGTQGLVLLSVDNFAEEGGARGLEEDYKSQDLGWLEAYLM